MRTNELLAMLEERNIKRSAIARALGLTPSRVTEIFKGERRVSLEEAATLVDEFDLKPPRSQIDVRTGRLLVQYLASQLGVQLDPESDQVESLAEDVKVFSEFAADPEVRETDSLKAFLQGRASTIRRSSRAA